MTTNDNLALDERQPVAPRSVPSSLQPPPESGPRSHQDPDRARESVESGSSSRSEVRKLRARRLRVHDLKLGKVVAHARHPNLGSIVASVEDLSLHGMALVVPGAVASAAMILPGDRLDHLSLEASGSTLYEGDAITRRVTESGNDLVIGVELVSRSIDLGELYRRGTRHSFVERFQAIEQVRRQSPISTEFKAWVADLTAYLQSTRQFLENEEKALEGQDLLTRQQALQQYLEEVIPPIVGRMNTASTELGLLVSQLPDEHHAVYRAFLRSHIMPFLRESPLLRRSYEKPLGYPGDYEVMNMLYREHAEGDSLFAKAMNVYAAQEGAARANINRISFLNQRILETVRSSDRPRVRIASIGCGPAREILQLLEVHPELGPRLDIALIDQEERSIAYCERTLGPVGARTGARFQFIRESVRRLLTARRLSPTLGERELIYSAGLFDYLAQRSFAMLLSALYEAVSEGGSLVVGNVASHNPSRWMLEYYLDWFLIHRSEADLLRFAEALEPSCTSSTVEGEPLGLNLFLSIRR